MAAKLGRALPAGCAVSDAGYGQMTALVHVEAGATSTVQLTLQAVT